MVKDMKTVGDMKRMCRRGVREKDKKTEKKIMKMTNKKNKNDEEGI